VRHRFSSAFASIQIPCQVVSSPTRWHLRGGARLIARFSRIRLQSATSQRWNSTTRRCFWSSKNSREQWHGRCLPFAHPSCRLPATIKFSTRYGWSRTRLWKGISRSFQNVVAPRGRAEYGNASRRRRLCFPIPFTVVPTVNRSVYAIGCRRGPAGSCRDVRAVSEGNHFSRDFGT